MLAIIGIIFTSLPSLKNIGNPAPALLPYMDFEATVISVSLDESENYLEGEEIVNAPSDSAIVRIDKIVETGGSSSFDWSLFGIEEGKEVTLDFKYTVRPTKIITVVGETTQEGVLPHVELFQLRLRLKIIILCSEKMGILKLKQHCRVYKKVLNSKQENM